MFLRDSDSALSFRVERVLVASDWAQRSVNRCCPSPEGRGSREFRCIVVPDSPCSQAGQVQKLLEVEFGMLSVLCRDSP
eukprot:2132426-Rhodomonas_salina.1